MLSVWSFSRLTSSLMIDTTPPSPSVREGNDPRMPVVSTPTSHRRQVALPSPYNQATSAIQVSPLRASYSAQVSCHSEALQVIPHVDNSFRSEYVLLSADEHPHNTENVTSHGLTRVHQSPAGSSFHERKSLTSRKKNPNFRLSKYIEIQPRARFYPTSLTHPIPLPPRPTGIATSQEYSSPVLVSPTVSCPTEVLTHSGPRRESVSSFSNDVSGMYFCGTIPCTRLSEISFYRRWW